MPQASGPPSNVIVMHRRKMVVGLVVVSALLASALSAFLLWSGDDDTTVSRPSTKGFWLKLQSGASEVFSPADFDELAGRPDAWVMALAPAALPGRRDRRPNPAVRAGRATAVPGDGRRGYCDWSDCCG